MGQPIESLAGFIAAAAWDDFPEPVRWHAKLVLLDTLGVILAGADRPEVQALRASLIAAPGPTVGATVMAPGWLRADAQTAAMMNAIAGRSIELCEGTRLVSGQPAIQIVPSLLAAGEKFACSGREFLGAFILGYDVAARLFTAFTPRARAHPNGQTVLVAAAAAGARLRGMDAAGISSAMRISTTLMLTPSYTNAVQGATTLNLAGGMSAFVGVLAPEFAMAGFEAEKDAVEQALGELVGSAFNPEHLLDEIGSRWEITRNYFRLYACCNPIHPALDALQEALARFPARIQAQDIERIDIATYRFAAVMQNPDPHNYFSSKYSLPHAAAVMTIKGSAGFAALDDAAVNDPAVMALRRRVSIVEDPAMSAATPRFKPATVTITLKDGRAVTHHVDSHRGDFPQPFTEAELRDKFRSLAGCALSAQGVNEVEQAIDRFDECSDLRAFADLLRRHGRHQ